MFQNDTASQFQPLRRPVSSTIRSWATRMSASCSCCSRISLASSPDQRDRAGIIKNKGQLRNMHARSLVALWLSRRSFKVPRSRQAEVQSMSWHRLCARHRLFGGTGRGGSKRCAGETKDLEQSDAGKIVSRVAVVVVGRCPRRRAGP